MLNNTAVHILSNSCDGGTPTTPNNTYGNGRVDILAAVDAVMTSILSARLKTQGTQYQVH